MNQAYQETLNYMYDQLPMFTRIGEAAYKADLNNTIRLCESLGNPQTKFKSIHIAGTNGKGSTSHMLASILQTAGYRTGLYTSPHIIDFRERIKINGIEIAETDVIEFIEQQKTIIEEIKPSFFEITVAMAFDYFAKQDVDIAIIEVGLGGLLDSTNILIPEISVITNISYDHMSLLGQTLQEIAIQKAGIIKDHISCVIGESQPELQNIFFGNAIKHKSQLFYADAIYEMVNSKLKDGKMHMTLLNKSSMHASDIILDLTGAYQYKNCKTVLTTIDILRSHNWNIEEKHILAGLEEVKKNSGIRGRFEIVRESPMIILDVSHNEAGLTELFRQIDSMNFNQLYIITGFVKDKEVAKAIKLFPKEAYYYYTQAQIPRAMPYHELEAIGSAGHLIGEACINIETALELAMNKANQNDLILVTGSFYILADAYKYLKL
jgi:dihydrofolate synthase/folylpolyglutamate synthase